MPILLKYRQFFQLTKPNLNNKIMLITLQISDILSLGYVNSMLYLCY
jgi:hypothetical protein